MAETRWRWFECAWIPALCRPGWGLLCSPCRTRAPCPAQAALPRGTICSAARKRHSGLTQSQGCIHTSKDFWFSPFSAAHPLLFLWCSFFLCLSRNVWLWVFCSKHLNPFYSSYPKAIPISLFPTIQRTTSPSLYGFHNEPAELLSSENSFFFPLEF